MKKSVTKNYIYNLIYQLLTIFTPLITTPYIARVLGVTNNGIYGYTLSIVTYFILFGSLGTNMFGQREIAYVQNDNVKRSRVFYEIMITKTLSYVIVITLFILLFCLRGNYAFYYRILIIELIANYFDISWFFQGIEDFRKTVVRNLIVKILGLVLVFIIINTENDLWKYFYIYVLADLIGNLSLWLYLPKYITKVKINNSILKKWGLILSFFIPQVAIQIYTVLDRTMVGVITSDMNQVAYYDQSQKIIKALLLIVSAMSAVMSSRIANCFINKEYDEIKNNLRKSFRMVWFVGLPFIFGLIVVNRIFVPIYFGDGYKDVVLLMNVSSLLLIIIGLSNVTGIQYLIQVNKQNKFTISVVIGALINFILNLFFIRKFGALGAVITSIIAELVIFVTQMLFCRKDIINSFEIFRLSIKYLISSIVMFIIIYLVSLNISESLITLLLLTLLGSLIYLIMLFILRDEMLMGMINKIFKKNGDKK